MVCLFQRVSAWVALAAFSLTLGLATSTLGHVGPTDDAACDPGSGQGRHAQVQLESATPTTVPRHCPFCHWQRVMGGVDFAALAANPAPLEPLGRVLPPAARAALSDSSDEHLSRGPPSLI
jgi:hypothetical protein